jgi:hypothetical protein
MVRDAPIFPEMICRAMKFGLAMGNPLSTPRVNEFGVERNEESVIARTFTRQTARMYVSHY